MDSELFILLDIANNHHGSVEHALRIIDEVSQVVSNYKFKIGIKLQYRDLDTFIHDNYKKRMDLKYVKRFTETRLSDDELLRIKERIEHFGFNTVCTPFDERSVDLLERHNFDIIKVASCSFLDWPLWERIAKTNKPIIASTACATLDEIREVVLFLRNRRKDFALLHCVAEYPTPYDRLQLDRIEYLMKYFPDIAIGFSSHESRQELCGSISAIAKGALILERHIALDSPKYKNNDYSITPAELDELLSIMTNVIKMCEYKKDYSKDDLNHLSRGIFAVHDIQAGYKIQPQDISLALSVDNNQVLSSDMSKYTTMVAKQFISKDTPILDSMVIKHNNREQLLSFVNEVDSMLKNHSVCLPDNVDIEVSHHYGLDKFHEYGMTIFTIVNQEYCKKLLVLLPGQQHPEQYHLKKTETFIIVSGEAVIGLNNVAKKYSKGDVVQINVGVRHWIKTDTGVIIEEISTTHYKDDSYYADPQINNNQFRKTNITHWIR